MPASCIYAITSGTLFYLPTNDDTPWDKYKPMAGSRFMCVSAHDNVIWALKRKRNNQIFVYVHGASDPLRACEEVYQHQEWCPDIHGFSDDLIKDDIPVFTRYDKHGNRYPSIPLPSHAWNWEGPWQLQKTFEGKPLSDIGCWTYGVDFCSRYTICKQWDSKVRRRKWIRYRQYICLNKFTPVPAFMKKDKLQLIDICVGGGEVLGEDADKLMVWGVSTLGKILFRHGICATLPEGSSWEYVPTLQDKYVTGVSIGRSGRLWATTWDGGALMRTGISKDDPVGLGWIDVDPPDNMEIHQMAVGVCSVWALCRDGSVWFRSGLSNNEIVTVQHSIHDNSFPGHSWLQIDGSMSVISVGPNDQLWGITKGTNNIVLRSGIIKIKLIGKTWTPLNYLTFRRDPDNEDNLFVEKETSEIEENKASLPYDEEPYPITHIVNEDLKDECKMKFYTPVSESPERPSDVLNNSSNICITEKLFVGTDSITTDVYNEETFLEVIHLNLASLNLNLHDVSDFLNTMTGYIDSYFPERPSDVLNNSSNISITTEDHVSASAVNLRASINSMNAFTDFVNSLIPKNDNKSSLSSKEENAIDRVVEDGSLRSSNASSIGSETLITPESIGSKRQEKDDASKLLQQASSLWLNAGGCRVMPPNYLPCPEEYDFLPWTVIGQSEFEDSGQWVSVFLELNVVNTKASLKVSHKLTKKLAIVFPCESIRGVVIIDRATKPTMSFYSPTLPGKLITFLFSTKSEVVEWFETINDACQQVHHFKKKHSRG